MRSDRPSLRRSLLEILRSLGPGLITGASDDDPSGIGTYSQVGAQFGFAMLWTTVFSYPLMVSIQEISARIGRVTGVGIAANLRRHYPRRVMFCLVIAILVANIINLGADIGAMGAACTLLVPWPIEVFVLGFGLLSFVLQIFVPYTRYVRYLKWLTLALFAYVATTFVVHVPWPDVAIRTLHPEIHWSTSYVTALVAVLGTTISPYLFVWQASQEVEEVACNPGEEPLRQDPTQARKQLRRIRIDTLSGMAVSNLVAFAIMLTTAVTLRSAGRTDISSAAQAASALEPLAGKLAELLFSLGIVGTGLLAVPVLAGSAAYGVAEALRLKSSLEAKPEKAKAFYAVIAAATLIGLALNFVGADPIRALYWAAVINGVIAAPIMVVIMHMGSSTKVMGKFVLPRTLKLFGWSATSVMFAAAMGLFATLF